jgi:hypothetical protein
LFNQGGANPQTKQASSPSSTKITPKIPRGLRRLTYHPSAPSPSTRSEYDHLKAEAAQIDQWWSTKSRWQHTKRVYSGACVPAVCLFIPYWNELNYCILMLSFG